MNVSVYVLDDMVDDLGRITESLKEIELSSQFNFQIDALTDTDSLPEKEYDLYIIDIDLGGKSGFDFAHTLIDHSNRITTPRIIFCTFHSDLVFDSFNLNVFYFIRKDYLKADLENALKKYQKEAMQSIYSFQFNDTTKKVSLHDIIYIDVSKNETYIHTATDEYTQRKSLKKVMDDLSSCDFIVRISNYCAINIQQIDHIVNGKVLMKNGVILYIARERLDEVKTKYMKGLLWN